MQLQSLNIFFPGKLVFGNNSLSSVADEIIVPGISKVLIITIEPLVPKLKGLLEKLKEHHIETMLSTGIVQEPGFDDFKKIMQQVQPFDADMVIGIGGGSVLDIAKLVAAQSGNDQQLEEYVGIGLLKGRKRKLICIPTTSGTGSEVSPNAILVDEKDGQKKGIISPFLVPDVVYADPVLTATVPPAITAATGMDALTHCLEAYTNKFSQPFIDMYALEGIRLISANLVTVVKNGADEEARSKVAMGSMLGGFCLGPVNTAGVHALSYPLGSMFHLAHGLSNALLLPYVCAFNLPAATERYAEVAVALGCERKKDITKTAWDGIEKIRKLNFACGIPARLRDAGISQESIPAMAKDAMKIQRLLKNNPRTITEADAIAIYKAAY